MSVDDLITELRKYEGMNISVRFIRLEPVQGEGQQFRRLEPLSLDDDHPFTTMRNDDDTLRVEIRLVSSQK
jgi:hypothetical protein